MGEATQGNEKKKKTGREDHVSRETEESLQMQEDGELKRALMLVTRRRCCVCHSVLLKIKGSLDFQPQGMIGLWDSSLDSLSK